MNIYLIGFMGTGKTTVGKILAEKLGRKFYDLDELIERKAGKSIRDIFIDDGEEHFRKIETEVLKEVAGGKGYIIATGGGLLTTEGNYEVMKESGVIITLAASAESIYERLKGDESRPLLMVENVIDEIKRLMFERAPLYIKADYIVDTSDVSPDEVAAEIMEFLDEL
ncbi:shikimate kinase [Deferribacter autotrophicus]|uniref:Shikimate kinase n=1 Tax=Deferribacter autotrophicus TaxID=500465 RepID=A0A5A8F2P0_9BACT|nr:shikimate kinase [Deferribacter autotrophicus]KAA0258395.1 shikimate kinase [Deferribacter autotrophicus]